MSDHKAGGPDDMEPVPTPTLLDAGTWVSPTPRHLAITPEQRVSLYSDKQWEEFVLEWATVLKYEQVMRSGGANDHGVDVAGFATSAGFDGEWDCYQCKHYNRALAPGDAYPEIFKIVVGEMSGHFRWPRAYRFVAPKGYSTTLSSVIHSPSLLKAGLREALTGGKYGLQKLLHGHPVDWVLESIERLDFTVFGTIELHDLVSQHEQTRWHSVRFGVDLPARPRPPRPGPDPTKSEQVYISKLLAAYTERFDEEFTEDTVAGHGRAGEHYLRQRVAFYSAEALRVFARDSVPDGTFDALQDEIYDGVVDVHDAQHPDGFSRLSEVTSASRGLAITANSLLPVVRVRDRTGICHQLANDHRLSWCHATAE